MLIMKLHFDFTTNQSLGNVNDNSSKDNSKSFENAKELIEKNQTQIERSIIDGFEKSCDEISNGMTIRIPVGHHSNAGFIDNLEFEVTGLNGDEFKIALTNVNNKTSKT